MDRYTLLFKKLCAEQKKTLLIATAGFMGFWVIIGMFRGFMGGYPDSGDMLITYIFLGSVFLTFAASSMFHEMSKKKGRISVLMTPASPVEKFLVRFFLVLPVMALVTIFGYFLYGISNSLTFALSQGHWAPFFNPFVIFLGENYLWMLFFSLFLLTDALFMFGSVAWPKRSYPKTLLLIALLVIIFFLVLWMIWKFLYAAGIYVRITDESAFWWSVNAWLLVFAVALIYGTYLMFKRKMID